MFFIFHKFANIKKYLKIFYLALNLSNNRYFTFLIIFIYQIQKFDKCQFVRNLVNRLLNLK